MSYFKPSLVTLALAAAGFSANIVAAEVQNDAQTQKAEEENVEVITVTGIRGSLQRAQAIKMSSNNIVEAISAEDIGKLPDTSIAESLARLPGVTGERRNGRTSGLSVRGFNENYIGTSLNGRELLGMGDNRGVEFDLYPTEIVSNILVYKTPEAGFVSQGIGGTIDLQTVSPLNADSTLTFNGNFEKNGQDSANPDYDNDGHRFSVNFVEKFADDTLGVALVVATQETPRQEEQFRGWGYPTVNTESDRRATDLVDVPEGTAILGGHDSFVRSAMLERDSVAAVIEWAPNDKLKMQLDALYIDFEENDARRGLEEGMAEWGTGAYTVTGVENGLATSAYHDGFHSVIRNDARQQKSELTTFGLNIEYQLNNDWALELDISTGEVDKTITDVESYSGVGRAGIDGRPATARSWQMTSTGVVFSDHPTIAPVDLTDPSLIRLAGPQAWGGGLNVLEPFVGTNTAQDGFVNQPIFDESLDSIRFQVNGVIDYGYISGIEAGVIYSDRKKSKINNGSFLTAPTWPNDGDPIPNPLGIADLGFLGLDGIIAYDSLGLFNSGYYTVTSANSTDNNRRGDTYTVKEETLTTYVRFDLEAEFGDIYVNGNFGLQAINVDQKASGMSVVTGADGFTVDTPVSDGDSYTDILPTLNLNFEVAENQYIRTAMSKVISRPRMDDMKPNNTVSFDFNDGRVLSGDPEFSPWSGNAGNAKLKPLEANQFDLSYENYFADDGYFAVSFFYKDIKNWHETLNILTDFSEFYIPEIHHSSDVTGNQAPATFLGSVERRSDGLEGFVRGYELQASVPMRLVHESLEGFGFTASATFLDGHLEDGSEDGMSIPGLSEESYSLTAYYESNGFEIRISGTKRDEFASETRGLSLALVDATDQGATLWDAQIGYDFSESNIEALHGLRVTLQAQNITDEDTIQTNGADSRQVTQYQAFGANYLLGFNYKF